jgi:hypothetical protein
LAQPEPPTGVGTDPDLSLAILPNRAHERIEAVLRVQHRESAPLEAIESTPFGAAPKRAITISMQRSNPMIRTASLFCEQSPHPFAG